VIDDGLVMMLFY